MKEKELKPCNTNCSEYYQGDCRLKLKDGKPNESSKAVIGVLCPWFRAVKTLI